MDWVVEREFGTTHMARKDKTLCGVSFRLGKGWLYDGDVPLGDLREIVSRRDPHQGYCLVCLEKYRERPGRPKQK